MQVFGLRPVIAGFFFFLTKNLLLLCLASTAVPCGISIQLRTRCCFISFQIQQSLLRIIIINMHQCFIATATVRIKSGQARLWYNNKHPQSSSGLIMRSISHSCHQLIQNLGLYLPVISRCCLPSKYSLSGCHTEEENKGGHPWD